LPQPKTTALQKVVTPLKNGVQRNAGKGYSPAFRETVKDGLSLFLVFLKIILVFLICHVKQTAQE